MARLFQTQTSHGPHLVSLDPDAALPGGEVIAHGTSLQAGPLLPFTTVGDVVAPASLVRSSRVSLRVPDGAVSGEVVVHGPTGASNGRRLRVGVPMAENLHPVANPAVDADGNVFVTFSGARGQAVPISIFRVARDFQVTPFVRDLLNASGLAFGGDGFLYVSSRAEGTVYRVSPEGSLSQFATGLGLATGLAFDEDGNLFVGDRSGTIFKIARDGEIFVFATLEPSIAAYHLAFNSRGVLFVTGPTTSSNQTVQAIDRDGNTEVFFRGLGRAQGLAFDRADNLYVVASFEGRRGIVRITPERQTSLAVASNNLVGLAFLEDGFVAVATRDALYHLELGVEGRSLL